MSYVYDDACERVIKTGPQGETAYVNQFYVVRNREVATKHVFASGSRLVSQLAAQPDENGNTQTPTAGNSGQTPWGWTNGNGNGGNNGNGGGNGNNNSGGTPFESDQYYYHPDHLGSSSYVTDIDGEIFQHVEYFPFGETFFQESSNTQRTPYLFTGKELDEETGLYYFGARYYDPRTSVWQSADPILARYLGGEGSGGGAFLPANLNLYGYAQQRPVLLTDPDGRCLVFIELFALMSDKCDRFSDGRYSVGWDLGAFIAHRIDVTRTGPKGDRARNIDRAIGIGLSVILNNAAEVGEYIFDNAIDTAIENRGYLGGRLYQSGKNSFIVSLLVRKPVGFAFSGSQLGATSYGGAINAIGKAFQELENAGIPASVLSSEALALLVSAGAAGMNIDYDSDSQTLYASHTHINEGQKFIIQTFE